MHLALRDAGAECAVGMLSRPLHALGTDERMAHVGEVIRLLQLSAKHARLAARSARATERERDFLRFLRVILQYVESVYALILNQAQMESKEHGFLQKFLGETMMDELSLTALNYRRRADDMLEGLWHVLRLSSAPYRDLQQANFNALTDSERERYRRARQAFLERHTTTMPAATAVQTPEPMIRNAASPSDSGAAEFAI